ncbi:MAG: helix-turn-helix transcriptional regulator [Campylobacterales bacterium]|nr:helix-turn-helix transcriptional regulator [Campylobacterales bacterium]
MNNFELDGFSVEKLYKTVGANVARVRKEKGISQLDLALSIGLRSSGLISVAELYHNKQHFNLEHLYKIAAVLECDICEFFRPLP